MRYIVTAFVFLLLGGLEALVMRAAAGAARTSTLLTPEQYNQLFTMHGVTMIFLYALPVLSGFCNYPLAAAARLARHGVPAPERALLLGLPGRRHLPLRELPARRGARRRLVQLRARTPSRDYNPGLNIDVYALGMVLLGISTTVGSANFVVTLLRTRAPGMSINRVPILVWGTLTASVGNLLAVPAVSLAFFLLWMDRQFGTHFFDVAGGGQPLLWQHLFWMFGHPWVYAIVLPAMGIVSDGAADVLPPAAGRLHAGGAGDGGDDGARLRRLGAPHVRDRPAARWRCRSSAPRRFVIAIPSAVAVFAWIATIWTGRPVFTTAVPLLRRLRSCCS